MLKLKDNSRIITAIKKQGILKNDALITIKRRSHNHQTHHSNYLAIEFHHCINKVKILVESNYKKCCYEKPKQLSNFLH